MGSVESSIITQQCRCCGHAACNLLQRKLWLGLEEPQIEPGNICAKDHKRNCLDGIAKEQGCRHGDAQEDAGQVLKSKQYFSNIPPGRQVKVDNGNETASAVSVNRPAATWQSQCDLPWHET